MDISLGILSHPTSIGIGMLVETGFWGQSQYFNGFCDTNGFRVYGWTDLADGFFLALAFLGKLSLRPKKRWDFSFS